MPVIISSIARIIAWAGASFITFKATELVEDKLPDQSNRQTSPATSGESFLQRLNRTWKNTLILAIVSGVILFVLKAIIEKFIKEKKRK